MIMGVATPGVHYESTVTWVRTLTGAVPSDVLSHAIEEARREWASANNDQGDAAPVQIVPVAGALLVKVSLDVKRHEVRPALHATRSVAARLAVDGTDAPPPR